MPDARDLLDHVDQGREGNVKKLMIEVMIKPDIQAQLARRIGLSQAMVSMITKELTDTGVVEVDRSQGRSREKVRLRAMRGVAVGIDIGFNHVSVVARPVDQPLAQAKRRRESPGINVGFKRLLPDLLKLIREAVDETGQGMADVVSAGLAVPRMVDPRTGRFTEPVLPPWDRNDDPAGQLTTALSLPASMPVVMDNDANLGALAEQTYGSAEEAVEHIVYVKASTGVGIGIVVGANLVRGRRGMAGEIGHLTIDPAGDLCLCGGRGCLDTVAGADSLIAKVKQSHRGTSRDTPSTLSELILKAKSGDAVCRRVLNDAGRTLGFGLAQLCNLINPHRIVVGGELADAEDLVLEPCLQELKRYALHGSVGEADDFELCLSVLSPYGEAHGALILGLRSRSSK